jgi:hypothetical protein
MWKPASPIHRIRTLTKKRGFEKIAGNVVVTFSGYAADPREVFAVPEIRNYWRALDTQIAELPALVACLPQVGFNGPGLHLLLLGTSMTLSPTPRSAATTCTSAMRHPSSTTRSAGFVQRR